MSSASLSRSNSSSSLNGADGETVNYKSLSYKDAVASVESKYRFSVKGSVNYIFSRFHLRDQRRDIFYEGALNLHEIVQFIPVFAENYVETGKEGYLYMFHVIYDQSSECISKFEGHESHSARHDEMRVQLLRLFDFFDRVFGVFFDATGKQKTRYRSDTPFHVLETAFKEYESAIVPELKKEYNI